MKQFKVTFTRTLTREEVIEAIEAGSATTAFSIR
jgi:hypothetical protein